VKLKVPKNAWDRAAVVPVIRQSPCGLYGGDLEPGVKFFVLMLEQLGAITEYSCEGHPLEEDSAGEDVGLGYFYIVFHATQELAREIHSCGFFSVEIERCGRWSLRTSFSTKNNQQAHLRWAAEAWEKNFGKLKLSRGLTAAARRAKTRKRIETPHAH
jgi:hypothetical protein